MSRIFLSHSSADNFEAIAVRDWLVAEGWDDIFLDIDAVGGIAAAARWERSLHEAATRCEAVVFLVSRAWLSSQWCLREFNLAVRLNKRLFGVLIEDIPVAELRAEMSAWQLVNLATGQDGRILRAAMDTGAEKHVTYSRAGLAKLKIGLQRAGLDPRFFEWPPKDDPDRPPYRGMKPLEAEDAGIFFGREAQVIEALDRLRGLADAAAPRFLAILGASGAGKSSFMRAGLLPRLQRDDRNFLPLPVIRPERAAISGDTGLVASLEEAARRAGRPRSRAEIRSTLAAGAEATAKLLAELAEVARPPQFDAAERPPAPAIVVAIDQGEELFLADGRSEAEAFLGLLAGLLAAEATPVIVLVTIRSDSYEALQTASALEGVRQATFSLPPMAKGAFQLVIEGPSIRLRDTNRALRIDPALTAALLSDIEADTSKDALPLLAFTLERLYSEHGTAGGGDLTLAHYRAMGGVKGSIEAAVARVMQAAETDPDLRNVADRPSLLRRAIIPWLASIDPDTKTPRRRVARLSEIPAEAQPFVHLLVAERLLSSEQAFDSDGRKLGDVTVEPAHETLLRQWGLLQTWLEEESAAYAAIEGIKRAAVEWTEHGREETWLAHQAGRLEDAERVAAREDFGSLLSSTERDYLAAARTADTRRRSSELARQKQLTRRTLIGAAVAGCLALFAIGLAYYGFTSAREATFNETVSLVALSRAARSEGFPVAAAKLALAAWPKAGDDARPALRRTTDGLAGAMPEFRERLLLKGHEDEVNSAAFSPDGTVIVTASSDKTVRIWDAESGTQLTSIGQYQQRVNSAEFSPDGTRIVTASDDGTARVWDAATGANVLVLKGHTGVVSSAAYSPDGSRIITRASDQTARIWDAVSGRELLVLQKDGFSIGSGRFSPDGKRIAIVVSDGTVRILEAEGGAQQLVLQGHEGSVTRAAFSPDGTKIVTGGDDATARVWDAATGAQLMVFKGHGAQVGGVGFSPDGQRIATGSVDKTARVWDVATGAQLLVLRGHESYVRSVGFSPDGARLVTASVDGSARVWDISTGVRLRELKGNDDGVWSVAFSPDGSRVAITSPDKVARILDAATGTELLALVGHQEGIYTAEFSRDGGRIVTASSDGTARIWNATTGASIRILQSHDGGFGSAAFSPDGTHILTTAGPAAEVWDVADGVRLRQLKCNEDLMVDAAFSPDGRQIVTASLDGTACVWATEADAPRLVLNAGDDLSFTSVGFSPDGKRIVTTSNGGVTRLWDALTGAKLVELSYGEEPSNAARFSPDGARLVDVEENAARVWDTQTGALLSLLLGHSGPVVSAAFSPNGNSIVTGSLDGTARIWDISRLEKGDAFQVACQRLGNNTDLSDVEARYGLSKLPPICGDHPPLPVEQMELE